MEEIEVTNVDVLVIGAGIAGLSFAIKIAEARQDLSINIITKSSREINNTCQAQGGIAVVLDKLHDSFENHIKDTLNAGRGLCDENVVEMVIRQAPKRLQELITWGTTFDTDAAGNLTLGLEGGHSHHRIVHHQDFTGLEIGKKLYQKARSLPNIKSSDHLFVTDLITEEDSGQKCVGVHVYDFHKDISFSISSKITFLATGGSGRIFQNTTNSSVATGDGVAMAYRAGAKTENMHFFQFHPTAFYEKNKQPLFLISEAVRGFGAYVVNHWGDRFLFHTDLRGELATRDIISAAIVKELKESGENHVYLDCRHLDQDAFKQHFPTIVAHCNERKLNLNLDLIPIVPAAHYQCGGISVDKNAQTSIENLYASGECAHTGLHGGNRLASNSLLEALVFSHQGAQNILKKIDKIPAPAKSHQPTAQKQQNQDNRETLKSFASKLNHLMTFKAVMTSDILQKKKILKKINKLYQELTEIENKNLEPIAYFELKNMLQTAILILEDGITQHKLQHSINYN